MPATPIQWEQAFLDARGKIDEGIMIARALANGKVTFVGLPTEDQRYLSDPSARQINDANRDMKAAANEVINLLQAVKAIP